jgi:hypothetical protein
MKMCSLAATRDLRSGALALALSLLLIGSASAQDKNPHVDSIGFIASKSATAKDVGLPIYPGARLHKDKSNDTSAGQLGLWGGSSGFKIVVLTLESSDPPAKIADFYRTPLSKYGPVLDCGKSNEKPESAKKKTDVIECCSNQARPRSSISSVFSPTARAVSFISSTLRTATPITRTVEAQTQSRTCLTALCVRRCPAQNC